MDGNPLIRSLNCPSRKAKAIHSTGSFPLGPIGKILPQWSQCHVLVSSISHGPQNTPRLFRQCRSLGGQEQSFVIYIRYVTHYRLIDNSFLLYWQTVSDRNLELVLSADVVCKANKKTTTTARGIPELCVRFFPYKFCQTFLYDPTENRL